MTHLVWDWNGTLLDDLDIVVAATNMVLALAGGGPVTAEEHRRDFRRPIAEYYGHVLGREVAPDEFALLDKVFHDAYREDLARCALAAVRSRRWTRGRVRSRCCPCGITTSWSRR